MVSFRHILSKYPKKTFYIAIAIFCIGNYVFAVDGIIIGNKKASKTFSTIKSDLNFSLNSGFKYHQSKNFNSRKSNTTTGMMGNTVTTYQKGNVIWVLPHRNTVNLIMDKFKTPSPSLR